MAVQSTRWQVGDEGAYIEDEWRVQDTAISAVEERVLASRYVEMCGSEHHSHVWFLGQVKKLLHSEPVSFEVECFRCRAIHRVQIGHIIYIADPVKQESQV